MGMSVGKRERIKEKLGGRLSVPSLPKLLERVEQAFDADASLREIGRLIAHDPPLTARLLREVNSAAYGLSTAVIAPEHAASVMGQRGLRNLLRRAPVFKPPFPLGAHGFDLRDLWRHSIVTAEVCRHMGGALPAAHEHAAEDLHVYGLLHDLGMFVMFEALRDGFVEVRDRARDTRRLLSELEREAFGFNHAELGAMLLKRWALPEELVRAARFHHNEGDVAEVDPIAAIVCVADWASDRARRQGLVGSEPSPPAKILDSLGMDDASFEELVEYAGECAERTTL